MNLVYSEQYKRDIYMDQEKPQKELNKKRKHFRFISGLEVDVSWHYGLKRWIAEAWMPELGELCNYRQAFGETRMQAVRRLRVAIAESKDPKISEVRRAMGRGAISWCADWMKEQIKNG